MVRAVKFIFFILWLHHCQNAPDLQFEEIHPPVSLQMVESAPSVYEINFLSDNQETGFAGYRIYTGRTRVEAVRSQVEQFETNKSFVRRPGWCGISTTLNFSERVRIQLGGNDLQTGFQCLVNDIAPIPGEFIALRAGVERDCTNIQVDNCFPWSEAASVQVPL